MDVINEFSLVSAQSKCFKSDILEFLQLKRCFKENIAASTIASSIALTEVKCHINSLLIKLYHFRRDSSELIANAKADMQFTFSAVLKNDCLSSLHLIFSSLELLSFPKSVVLAKCITPSPTSSALDISLLEVNQAEIELCLSFPSLDIWIHFSEWVDIIDYAGQFSKIAPLDTSSNSLTLDEVESLNNKLTSVSPGSLSSSSASTHTTYENMRWDSVVLTVKMENICITCHFPMCLNNKACGEFPVTEDRRGGCPIVSSNIRDGSDLKYISVTMHSKSSELLLDGRNMKMKTNMEKWSGTMAICEDGNVLSWPFFQMSHVFMEAQGSHDRMQSMHVKVDLQCDHLNMWLSHHFFYFWHGVTFVIPEAESSRSPFGSVDFKVKMRKVSFLLSDGRV